jgi:hypothetical protein
MRLRSVVLPAPRKPVRTVTGIIEMRDEEIEVMLGRRQGCGAAA